MILTTHITPEYIRYGEALRVRSDLASKALYTTRDLGLLTPDLEYQLLQEQAYYNNHCQTVLNFVANMLPEEVQTILPKKNDCFCGHYFPSILLMKNNRVQIKFGSGWFSMYLLLDIETNKLYKDTFYISIHERDLSVPSEKEAILKELMKPIIND